MRVADSFQFEVKDRGKVIRGIGTIYDIEIKPATRQVFVTFKYETEDGKSDELTVDLGRFFEIVVMKQQTL